MESERRGRVERGWRDCWWVCLALFSSLFSARHLILGALLTYDSDQNKPGEIWAIAISADGQYLAGSSINGKVNVWSLNKAENMPKIREYETKGSFGLCVDLVRWQYSQS
jgi:WD40 repeat protein